MVSDMIQLTWQRSLYKVIKMTNDVAKTSQRLLSSYVHPSLDEFPSSIFVPAMPASFFVSGCKGY